MKPLCKHCQNPCKKQSACDKFNPKSERIKQLEKVYPRTKEIQAEIDYFYYGIKN